MTALLSGLTNERPRPLQRRRSGGWTLTTMSGVGAQIETDRQNPNR